MTADFEPELRAARKLKEILDKEEGMQQSSNVFKQVGSVLQNELFALPKRALDTIYEKLEVLKTAGLKVERQEAIYKDYIAQLKEITQNLQAEPTAQTSAVDVIEHVIQNLRAFFYLMALIDYFKGEVDSMCHNHIAIMSKLSP